MEFLTLNIYTFLKCTPVYIGMKVEESSLNVYTKMTQGRALISRSHCYSGIWRDMDEIIIKYSYLLK